MFGVCAFFSSSHRLFLLYSSALAFGALIFFCFEVQGLCIDIVVESVQYTTTTLHKVFTVLFSQFHIRKANHYYIGGTCAIIVNKMHVENVCLYEFILFSFHSLLLFFNFWFIFLVFIASHRLPMSIVAKLYEHRITSK